MAKQWICGILRDIDAELERERKKTAILKEIVESAREWELARIAARYELESDEFSTARDKAISLKR